MTPTIVFDFDGTLALGDGPLTAFARAIAERTGDATFTTRANAALAAFDAGTIDYRDGYDAVTRTAVDEGITPEITGASYGASRALLGSASAPVTPPDGLAAFLARVGVDARLVLATNAPGDGVVAVLESWGVADAFDAMHFTVGKPDGLVPVLRDALAQGPVLSVGDIFAFDLAPAVQLGADTALVGSTSTRSDATTTLRARSVVDLYDDIIAWVASATASSSLPSSDSSPRTERHN